MRVNRPRLASRPRTTARLGASEDSEHTPVRAVASSETHSVSLTIRLPRPLAEQVEVASRSQRTKQSALVREFIRSGLSRLAENKESARASAPADPSINPLNPFEDLMGTWTYGPADEYIRELRRETE